MFRNSVADYFDTPTDHSISTNCHNLAVAALSEESVTNRVIISDA
jgi:hypothetical protein